MTIMTDMQTTMRMSIAAAAESIPTVTEAMVADSVMTEAEEAPMVATVTVAAFGND